MSLNADSIVDRRRLRRKLIWWRSLALIAVVAVIAAVWRFGGGATYIGESSPHVARITVGGLIRNDRQRLQMLERIGNSGAKAVIVTIDSPGGTVAGSEALYKGLRRLSEKKPVVAVVEGAAASGAYITAIAADHIVAPRNGIIGSIGVVFQYPNLHELLKSVGVSMEAIKSSPLKAAPNGYEPTSPEARAAVNALVVDSYDWFKELVRERRNLDPKQLAAASDGRVFTANQALPLRLVDQIGDERTAREWLEANKGVSKDLKVRDWRSRGIGNEFRWLSTLASVLELAGLNSLATLVGSGTLADAAARAQLDGLLALWQPPFAE